MRDNGSLPLRVLVIDDSALYRKIVSDVIGSLPGFEVVGTAMSGEAGLNKIPGLRPQVVTLDYEMPGLDGLQTLKRIKEHHPDIEVVMVSSFTLAGAQITIKALSAGAFDFATKPQTASPEISFQTLRQQLAATLEGLLERRRPVAFPSPPPPPPSAAPLAGQRQPPPAVIAVGVSTGGPRALEALLGDLPASFPAPLVIVQHMPPLFTRALAESLNAKSAIAVVEGEQNMPLAPATAYIAPGGRQMKIQQGGRLAITDDPPENHCRPAADYLFRSVAVHFGNRALGLIMTGMGMDGTAGLRHLKARGASTIAQSPESCIVASMPGAAIRAGVIDQVLPLAALGKELAKRFR